jgi:hypothetical protein
MLFGEVSELGRWKLLYKSIYSPVIFVVSRILTRMKESQVGDPTLVIIHLLLIIPHDMVPIGIVISREELLLDVDCKL